MRLAQLRKLGRPITPRDLRNPERISGYNYVGENGTGSRPYQCDVYGGKRDTAGRQFKGPRRQFAEQAAVDFCDYVNGAGVQTPAVLVTAGHEYEVDERDPDPEYQAALGVIRDRKAQKAGKQGYVYLIVEDIPGGALIFGKIGYSTNPRKRVAELQTGNPRALRLHLMKPGTEEGERLLHKKYIGDNVMQEWFRLTKPLLLEWDAEHQVGRA